MLIALGKGDKYRLMHIRETLERGKELYISDKNFLQNLVKTYLKDRIYQARVVSTPEQSKQFCENCGSELSAEEMFCTNCGVATQEPSPPTTLDVPEPTPEQSKQFCENCGSELSAEEMFCTNCGVATQEPSPPTTLDVPESTPKPKKKSRQQELEEYESKYMAKSERRHAAKGFTITDDGEIGKTSTRKTTRRKPRSKSKSTPPKPKKKSRQQELEEYEKKHLGESETDVSWQAYDVKAKKKVEIQNPKVVKMKNGKWAVKGTSPITGIKVFRIVGSEKPTLSAGETTDSPKPKKEVVSRYYRPPGKDDSPKAKRSKSKKSNKFCEECGSKIATKDMFCTNCGAER